MCITEGKVLKELKQKEIDKKNAKEEKATKQLERVHKQKEQEKAAAKAAVKAKKDQQQKVLKKNTSVSHKDTKKIRVDWFFQLMIQVTSGYVVIAVINGLIVTAQQLEVVRGTASESSIVHARLLPHIWNLCLIVASCTYFVCNLFCLVCFNLK